jgi:small-conductance mechanosensitive channel
MKAVVGILFMLLMVTILVLPMRRFDERVLERQRIRRLAKAGRAADHIINRMQTALTEASGVSPIGNPRLLRSHLVWWWTTYRPRLLRRLALIAAAIALTYLGMVSIAWRVVTGMPEAWRKDPLITVSGTPSFGVPEATVLVRISLVALFMYFWWRTGQFTGRHPVPYRPTSETQQRRPEHYAPVAQLVFHTTRAAEHLALLQSGLRTLPEPFSVRAAERAVRSAHSARFTRRAGHRRALRRHGEKVAGALREAEYHQHVDPHQALTEITRMLAQITERCAQGRLGSLLDEDDEWMRVARPARGHDLLKMLAAGLIITAISASALLAGLPDGAVGTLIGTLAPLLVVLLFRSQMPSGNALIDLFRSADRSAQ